MDVVVVVTSSHEPETLCGLKVVERPFPLHSSFKDATELGRT